jgi:phage-related protein
VRTRQQEERVPQTRVVFYREEDGTVPLLEWLDKLPARAQAKCRLKIERLRALGFELRRPEADFLRNGIYELRVSLRRIQYRMLYFFFGNTAAVVSHGIIKDRQVPPKEIEMALERKRKLEQNPIPHMHLEV